MARVVDTDNFGSDYPDEVFMSESLPEEEARALADKLNGPDDHGYRPRYYKVVSDDYKLVPGFEP